MDRKAVSQPQSPAAVYLLLNERLFQNEVIEIKYLSDTSLELSRLKNRALDPRSSED